MTSASLSTDENVCQYQLQEVISKQQTTTKRINCINSKTQVLLSSSFQKTPSDLLYQMDSTSVSCSCRKRVYFTTLAIQNILYVLLLVILLPLLYNNSILVVRAAPYPHQSDSSSSSPEAADLVEKTLASPNAINSTILLELQQQSLKTNSLYSPSSTSPPSSISYAERHSSRALKKAWLSNRTIVCNDGTAAGFYLRKNPNSKKWIVFLEGGWHCYDVKTCRALGGILSASPEENPYWHSANHVLVPYCSSDSWSGTKDTFESNEFSFRFMGALILKQVIADLIPMGLGRVPGAELLLVGSSAGGLGVMLNLDRITQFLQEERKLQVMVRGVSDSGWFLDREPYTPSAVASSEAVRQGWSLWKGLLPKICVEQHKSEPWRCYFGYRLYPTLKAPLFVFQWLFDEAQMRADNVAAPVTPHQWNYIHAMGAALRSSLDNVTAVFAPSCIGHAVLSKRDWTSLKIDDISLPTALRCWEHSTRPRKKRHNNLKRATESTLINKADNNKRRHEKQHKEKQRDKNRKKNSNSSISISNNNGEKKRLTKAEREERKRLRHEQQKRREERRNRRKNNMVAYHESNLTNSPGLTDNSTVVGRTQQQRNNKRKRNEEDKNKRYQKQKRRQRKRKEHNAAETEQPERELQKEQPLADNVEKRNNSSNKINRRSGVPRVPERCSLRLLERCSWPQCNHSCPTLTNPVTGEEMRFLELLASFGLDIEAVAAALGVDMQTLNNMDRTELVNMLTQQVS
ncbi:hypothetical protein DOY81_005627 [Sarcophaga bullata]|nr:hypothetical protein DOY81_005627 [Sarcophaga bullata]